MSRPPILIVDDVETHLTLFSATLEAAGHSVITASSISEARELALQHKPDIALIDVVLADGSGLDLIAELKATLPSLKPIAITAFASVDRAVSAMQNGAVDFLAKPLDCDQLLTTISHVINGRSIGQQLDDASKLTSAFDGHIGSSQAMQSVLSTISAVAGSAAPVFITGENGSGKIMAAESIHRQSGFRDGSFIVFDCSTAPPDQIEAQLIGHQWQGEDTGYPGLISQADGGTFLLDEVCALPLPMQARLLGILQIGAITPLGGLTPQPVNFRLICTSTTDPRAEVTAGRFRADLFYRLNVVPIHIPPLRARGSDVVEIAETELDLICAREGRPFRTLSHDVKARFMAHSWPGNVRELMNVLWNIALLHDAPVVDLSALPPYLRNLDGADQKSLDGTLLPNSTTVAPSNPFEGKTLAEIERQAIEYAIQTAEGSIPAAARTLGVSPSTLYRKLEGWGKPVRSKREV